MEFIIGSIVAYHNVNKITRFIRLDLMLGKLSSLLEERSRDTINRHAACCISCTFIMRALM